jgi:hypothetical protein
VNKNIGDAFLAVWKPTAPYYHQPEDALSRIVRQASTWTVVSGLTGVSSLPTEDSDEEDSDGDTSSSALSVASEAPGDVDTMLELPSSTASGSETSLGAAATGESPGILRAKSAVVSPTRRSHQAEDGRQGSRRSSADAGAGAGAGAHAGAGAGAGAAGKSDSSSGSHTPFHSEERNGRSRRSKEGRKVGRAAAKRRRSAEKMTSRLLSTAWARRLGLGTGGVARGIGVDEQSTPEPEAAVAHVPFSGGGASGGGGRQHVQDQPQLPPELRPTAADAALQAAVDTLYALARADYIQQYAHLPGVQSRIPGYTVRMGFGLHYGWAIEGAIGSKFKIDASYLSPHVNMASRLVCTPVCAPVMLLLLACASLRVLASMCVPICAFFHVLYPLPLTPP